MAAERGGRGGGVWRGRSRAVRVAVVAVVVVVVFVAVDAVFLSGVRFDKYDDSIRGTDKLVMRVSFGQRIGPDGDGCWLEGSRVFCDLVSVGGLHWDAGDVRVEDPVDIYIGSGHLCVVADDGGPVCWEWSSEVAPRRARVPRGGVFSRIVGASGFACGQAADFREVVCWSLGVGQSVYREQTHRFDDGPERVMFAAHSDPDIFSTLQRETGKLKRHEAFLGESGSGAGQ